MDIQNLSANVVDGHANDRSSMHWWWGSFTCVVLACLAIVLGVYQLVEKPRAEARVKVLSNATAEIPKLFSTWAALTSEGESVVHWRGIESVILYIQPEGDEAWRVWAKSKRGRIYIVRCWLTDELTIEFNDMPTPSTQDVLVRQLVNDGRTDLMQKLGVQVDPA